MLLDYPPEQSRDYWNNGTPDVTPDVSDTSRRLHTGLIQFSNEAQVQSEGPPSVEEPAVGTQQTVAGLWGHHLL